MGLYWKVASLMAISLLLLYKFGRSTRQDFLVKFLGLKSKPTHTQDDRELLEVMPQHVPTRAHLIK